jgi:uncharacterized membrane protein
LLALEKVIFSGRERMASFDKKLKDFLNAAVDSSVIGEPIAANLINYNESGDYQQKGWLSLSAAMGGIGSLIFGVGIILIIASNWHMFNDLTKIIGFILLLGGSHFGGLVLAAKGYGKSATSLHSLGSVLFIAGIGLMAQIFHLHSETGVSFLMWGLMILPLAILLRSGEIAALSCVALTIWSNIRLHNVLDAGWYNISFFNAGLFASLLLIGLLLSHKKSGMAQYFKTPGAIGLVGSAYFLGFTHSFIRYQKPEGELVLFAFLPFIVSLCIGGYLLLINKDEKANRYFLGAIGVYLLTLVAWLVMHSTGVDKESYFTYFNFNHPRKIYYFPLLVSVLAWISYFAIAFWGVIYGALHHKRWMLNCNILLIGIGIFTRFIDLMGSMMDTGLMFIGSGVLLLVIGFAMEKWRRKLIENAKTSSGSIE